MTKSTSMVVEAPISKLEVYLAAEENIRRFSLKIFGKEVACLLEAQGVRHPAMAMIYVLADFNIHAMLPKHADRFGISRDTMKFIEDKCFAVDGAGGLFRVLWDYPTSSVSRMMRLKPSYLVNEYVSVATLKNLIGRIQREEYLATSPYVFAGMLAPR